MQLKRTLNRIETVALSVAVIAMMVGMTLNTPFVAGPAGTAVPLVYIISTIGVLCIALSLEGRARRLGLRIDPLCARPEPGLHCRLGTPFDVRAFCR